MPTKIVIEKLTGISRRTVNNIITDFEKQADNGIFADFGKNNQMIEFTKFRDFEREDTHLKIYDIWDFSKATNECQDDTYQIYHASFVCSADFSCSNDISAATTIVTLRHSRSFYYIYCSNDTSAATTIVTL